MISINYLRVPILLVAITLWSAAESRADDKRGFALNVGVGVSEISDKDGADRFKGNSFGYSIGAEYRFNRNFAVGLGIFNLGTAEDQFAGTNTEIEVRGGDVVIRFIAPVNEGFEFFGTFGQSWYTADLEPGGSNGPFGDTALELGLGMDIGSGPLSFRLAGRYFDGPKDEAGALLTAGVNYRFK